MSIVIYTFEKLEIANEGTLETADSIEDALEKIKANLVPNKRIYFAVDIKE